MRHFLSKSRPSGVYRTTEMDYKVDPMLREYRLLASSGHGHEFTQPRVHLIYPSSACDVILNGWAI